MKKKQQQQQQVENKMGKEIIMVRCCCTIPIDIAMNAHVCKKDKNERKMGEEKKTQSHGLKKDERYIDIFLIVMQARTREKNIGIAQDKF